MLAGTGRPPFSGLPVRTGGSSEYTTVTPVIPRRESSRRITRHSGHTLVFSIGATLKRAGSSLLPQPIALISGIALSRHSCASASLALTISMQSATKSQPLRKSCG